MRLKILRNAGLLLGHRLRRWPNSKPTLAERLVLAEFSGSEVVSARPSHTPCLDPMSTLVQAECQVHSQKPFIPSGASNTQQHFKAQGQIDTASKEIFY